MECRVSAPRHAAPARRRHPDRLQDSAAPRRQPARRPCQRVTLVLAVWAAILAPALARRRVVIEVPVHIRSHQHTHTVYRPLPVVHAAPAVPVAPVAPAQLLLQPMHQQPAHHPTLVGHGSEQQRVAHHAAPGGLTSITLVNMGRGGGGSVGPAEDDGGVENDAEMNPEQQRRLYLPRHQPQQQPQQPPQRHHVSGLNYQRTEHTAQVYR